MSGAITWSPLLPWPLVAALAGIGLALLVFGATRRARGTVWRSLALILLAVALLEPRLISEDRAPQGDIAVVAVDTSPSQRTGERRERARDALATLRENLAEHPDLEVRIIEVPGAGPDGSEGTPLNAAVERAASEIPSGRFAGAVMITDGQVHDAPETAEDVNLPGPVHVLLTGRHDETDRRIVVETVPGYGIVGNEITIAYRIEDRPAADGATARVTLRRDGETVGEETVPVGARHEATLTLEHGGPTVIEIEAEPLAGELSDLNNRAVVAVNGVRDRLRVLLVSGQPHLGERTWRNLLKSDPAVDLVHFTILRPPDKDDFTPLRELALIAFPTQELFEKRIDEFDLIVFDRYIVRNVLPPIYFDNIVNFVRGGGAVLLAVGPEFAGPRSLANTSLADILPVQPTGRILEEGFRPVQTTTGHRHPVTAALERVPVPGRRNVEAAWGRWFRQIEGTAAGGQVLMEGPDATPLMVLDRIEDGRVAQVMSDHVWLWARGFDGGGPHSEAIRRLAHWLMKEPDLEEEALRAEAHDGQLTVEWRSLEEDPISVTVTAPDGSTQTLTLEPGDDGRAVATVPTGDPGLYRVEDGTRTVLAAVGALNAPELADLRSTPEKLETLTDATGGSVHWIADGTPSVRRTLPGRDAGGRDWIGLRRNDAHVVTGIIQVPLLPWWLVLPLGLGLFAAAWWREGR